MIDAPKAALLDSLGCFIGHCLSEMNIESCISFYKNYLSFYGKKHFIVQLHQCW